MDEESKKANNIVVCFPARNEENLLTRVLNSLEQQTHKPIKVIIADDGSEDKTVEIAQAFEFVEIHRREKRGFDVVGKIEMGKVWNSSLTPARDVHKETSIEYIVFLGGDMVLPKNYLEDLVNKFDQDPKLMIAAGTMVGENAYTSTGFMIPGPGRMMRYSYWEKLGSEYPLKQGWEAYPVYMANMEGYKSKIFDDIEYEPLRITGGRTDYYAYGMAMKAFGYFFLFAIGRSFKQIFMRSRGFSACYNMLKGFLFGKPEKYEKELRQFVNKSQRKRLRKLIFRF
ncbi:MAG: hypothetical protein HeimC2_18090 [Candidatus Heimdallarchaeota archaeon LC_2]|nr:MAG: hypothetical protein HeimC2_18090 [Candidatus Heimdallarchaeota archaeon LC_2]